MTMIRKNTISHVMEIMFPLLGVWPDNSCALIGRAFWVSSEIFIELCHCRYFLSHLSPDYFFDLMDCLCSFLAHAKLIIELALFWANQRKLTETLALMTDDWNERVNDDANLRLMASKAKTSRRITNAIMILHTMAIIAYCTRAIFVKVDLTDKTADVPYINKLDIPFDINTEYTYRFVLVAEYVHLLLCNWVTGIVNSVLLTLILHAGGQIDILRDSLTKLVPEEIENVGASIVPVASKIIQKHQRIIYFCENIESLYTHIALMLFALNTIMICSLGFLIVTAIGTPDATEQIVKSLLFYTITNLEAFLYCFAGKYLINKGTAVGFAAYNCAWYNLKPRDSRVLLFVILRSQKQLALTAGKMMDLSLESFTSIMNASGSYLSVLLAMQ